MSADTISWLAETTGFPFIGVDARGALRTNEAADMLFSGQKPSRVEDAIGLACGVTPHDVGLIALIGGARSIGRSARDLGRFRVVVVFEGEEMGVVLIPEALAVASDVHRRAAATDLSAAVSHELSNVLGAILGWATLARRTADLDPKTDHALALIEKSARSANATARHLLDTARGRVVVPGSLVDAGALVEEVVEVLSPKAMHRGVVLDVTAEEGLMVAGSRADLFTIAWNLIQNAIEATPLGGGVKVSLEATRRGARLRITDEGSGISDDIRTRVFEPYFTTKEDGTGLGLSLVRRAADALGASVALEDSDAGACFVCELPTTVPGAEAPPRRQSGVLERQSPRGKRILVVDDDEAMRDLLATTLGLAGATVETAGSGEEALQTTGHFDLVLIDFSLGDARGDQLLSDLQGRGQVGASALVSGASLPPTLAASPDAWLRKPFELDDLLGAISSLLSSTIDKDVRSG